MVAGAPPRLSPLELPLSPGGKASSSVGPRQPLCLGSDQPPRQKQDGESVVMHQEHSVWGSSWTRWEKPFPAQVGSADTPPQGSTLTPGSGFCQSLGRPSSRLGLEASAALPAREGRPTCAH